MRFIGSPKNYLAGLVALLAVTGAGCGGGGTTLELPTGTHTVRVTLYGSG